MLYVRSGWWQKVVVPLAHRRSKAVLPSISPTIQYFSELPFPSHIGIPMMYVCPLQNRDRKYLTSKDFQKIRGMRKYNCDCIRLDIGREQAWELWINGRKKEVFVPPHTIKGEHRYCRRNATCRLKHIKNLCCNHCKSEIVTVAVKAILHVLMSSYWALCRFDLARLADSN